LRVRTPFGDAILRPVRFAGRDHALLILLAESACAPAALVITPTGAPASVCPAGGCRAPDDVLPTTSQPNSLCATSGDAPCAGASAAECTATALSAWSESGDDRSVACVARMLADACALQDARACLFAGRLSLDGRGTSRDAQRGLEMLVRGCDGGVAMACGVATRWLGEAGHAADVAGGQELLARLEGERTCLSGQAEACFQIGLNFYYGREAFPRDRASSSRAFSRGCDLGDSRACNNLGDALAYGDGVGRDVEGAASSFRKACRLGEALGCANLGYMAEHGEGVARDVPRARGLYGEACAAGDVYGCLHLDLLAAQDAGAPRDPDRALAHWRHACEHGHIARACAFVGVMYEDGPDGVARDEERSMQAMARACDLGDTRACEWVKSHRDD
jgi:TPR repeat protein